MREGGGQAGPVNGSCQSAIGFSICRISPRASKRQLNRDSVPAPVQIIKRSVSSAAADCGRLVAAKNWSPAAGHCCRCSDVTGRQDGGPGEGRRSNLIGSIVRGRYA